MARPPAPAVAHHVRRAITIAAATIAAGCIALPTDYRAADSRENVSAKTSVRLQPGVTTIEDVLLLLGEPEYVSDDGRRIGYAWARVNAIIIIISTGPGAGVLEVQRSHLVQISFDSDGRVTNVALREHWGPQVPPEAVLLPR
jgi:outer membrane protein assembly factor BamE (lipoprotein component of BamABCDE complex)